MGNTGKKKSSKNNGKSLRKEAQKEQKTGFAVGRKRARRDGKPPLSPPAQDGGGKMKADANDAATHVRKQNPPPDLITAPIVSDSNPQQDQSIDSFDEPNLDDSWEHMPEKAESNMIVGEIFVTNSFPPIASFNSGIFGNQNGLKFSDLSLLEVLRPTASFHSGEFGFTKIDAWYPSGFASYNSGIFGNQLGIHVEYDSEENLNMNLNKLKNKEVRRPTASFHSGKFGFTKIDAWYPSGFASYNSGIFGNQLGIHVEYDGEENLIVQNDREDDKIRELIAATKNAVLAQKDDIVCASADSDECVLNMSGDVDAFVEDFVEQDDFLKKVPVDVCESIKADLEPTFRMAYDKKYRKKEKEKKAELERKCEAEMRREMPAIVLESLDLPDCISRMEDGVEKFCDDFVERDPFFEHLPHDVVESVQCKLKGAFEEFFQNTADKLNRFHQDVKAHMLDRKYQLVLDALDLPDCISRMHDELADFVDQFIQNDEFLNSVPRDAITRLHDDLDPVFEDAYNKNDSQKEKELYKKVKEDVLAQKDEIVTAATDVGDCIGNMHIACDKAAVDFVRKDAFYKFVPVEVVKQVKDELEPAFENAYTHSRKGFRSSLIAFTASITLLIAFFTCQNSANFNALIEEFFPPTPQLYQGPSIRILSFGETGEGKSYLGNYLLGANDETFPIGSGSRAKTKETRCEAAGDYKHCDTPGLNENPCADFQHTIDLVEKTKNMEFHAGVFVWKIGRLTDARKRGLLHFRTQFPALFHAGNVAVVRTGAVPMHLENKGSYLEYEEVCGEKADGEREMDDLVELLGFDLRCFRINAAPRTASQKKFAFQQRQALLHWAASLAPVEFNDTMIAKTQTILHEDQITLARHKERIEMKVQEVKTKYKPRIAEYFTAVSEYQANIRNATVKIKRLQNELERKMQEPDDTPVLFHTHKLKVDCTCKNNGFIPYCTIIRWFNIQSPTWLMQNYHYSKQIWDGNEFSISSYEVHGKPDIVQDVHFGQNIAFTTACNSKSFGIPAIRISINLFTTKQERYKEYIIKEEARIEKHQSYVDRNKKELRELKRQNVLLDKDDKLDKYNSEFNDIAFELESPLLTHSQARKRWRQGCQTDELKEDGL